MAVHLYGHPANMNRIMSIARRHELFVIEDCAEAFGSRIDHKHVGTFGDIATFSFFGNKTITGEGGMVVTSDQLSTSDVSIFKGQRAWQNIITYWHDVMRSLSYD